MNAGAHCGSLDLESAAPARLIETGPCAWRIQGRLDFETLAGLAAAGAARLRARTDPTPLEIDLAEVTAANSAGLALLLEWLDLARSRGQTLVYRRIPDALLRIAHVSNLGGLLPVAPSDPRDPLDTHG